MKAGKIIFTILVVAILVVVVVIFNYGSQGAPNSARYTGPLGASLLYDTLQHMGYPVRISNTPVTAYTPTNSTYVIIQPTEPRIDEDKMWELLAWVEAGGQLILITSFNPPLTRYLPAPTSTGNIRVYNIGAGQLVTGRVAHLTNRALVLNYETGAQVHSVISAWGAAGIFFAEYYHGGHNPGNFFTNLPLVVRIIIAQFGLVAIAGIWHTGKRFGNAIPNYSETERTENEHVHALARLYMKLKKWG